MADNVVVDDNGTKTVTSEATQSGSTSQGSSAVTSSQASEASYASSEATSGAGSQASAGSGQVVQTSSAASEAGSGASTPASSSAGSSAASSEAPINNNDGVLTDDDYYNSQAFKDNGLLKPNLLYDPDHNFGFEHDDNFLWVKHQLLPNETLVMMWQKYKVGVRQVMNWSYIYDYHWQNQMILMRVDKQYLPHD